DIAAIKGGLTLGRNNGELQRAIATGKEAGHPGDGFRLERNERIQTLGLQRRLHPGQPGMIFGWFEPICDLDHVLLLQLLATISAKRVRAALASIASSAWRISSSTSAPSCVIRSRFSSNQTDACARVISGCPWMPHAGTVRWRQT